MIEWCIFKQKDWFEQNDWIVFLNEMIVLCTICKYNYILTWLVVLLPFWKLLSLPAILLVSPSVQYWESLMWDPFSWDAFNWDPLSWDPLEDSSRLIISVISSTRFPGEDGSYLIWPDFFSSSRRAFLKGVGVLKLDWLNYYKQFYLTFLSVLFQWILSLYFWSDINSLKKSHIDIYFVRIAA